MSLFQFLQFLIEGGGGGGIEFFLLPVIVHKKIPLEIVDIYLA